MSTVMWVNLEGTDAAGKTTLMAEVARLLAEARPDYEIRTMPEFSTGPVGELISGVVEERYFFQLGDGGHLPVPEAMLLACDLALQLEQFRRPNGRPVVLLSDRGPLSIVVYQALRMAASGSSERSAVEWLRQMLSALPWPELTLILKVPPGELEQRLMQRGVAPDCPEAQFVHKAQAMFLAQAGSLGASDNVRVLENSAARRTVVPSEIIQLIDMHAR